MADVTARSAACSLTSVRAVQVARQAALAAGLPPEQAELIRIGSNAILRLVDGTIVRIARDTSWYATAEREVRVALALLKASVPCVNPLPVRQPLTIAGHPVTFWAEIPGPLGRPDPADLGSVLRRMHAVPDDVDVPPLDPWAHIAERIYRARIGDADRRRMHEVLDTVRQDWPTARFELGAGLIHGDAHLGNLVRSSAGNVVLTDLDSVCTGPREWDLTPTGLYATSLGWISRTQYAAFVAAYGGYDITTAPAFPLLSRMRELRMTAWLAMHTDESDLIAAEVAHRIDCLVDPALPRHWVAR